MLKIVILNDGKSFKEKVQNGFNKLKNFVVRNKETVLFLTPVVITGLTGIVKFVGRRVNLKTKRELKENYCYDRSLGHYWKLRRELSNNEWLEIDRRKKKGERLADVLSEMKVLD